ncbi:MAG: hypothetical protein ACRDF7_03870 [Candidatus Limnocylindrales bacterium]
MDEAISIDIGALATRARAIRDPNEDVEEALLRASKELYPDVGDEVFSAISAMLRATTEKEGGDRAAALDSIAARAGSTHMTVRRSVWQHGAPAAEQRSGHTFTFDRSSASSFVVGGDAEVTGLLKHLPAGVQQAVEQMVIEAAGGPEALTADPTEGKPDSIAPATRSTGRPTPIPTAPPADPGVLGRIRRLFGG